MNSTTIPNEKNLIGLALICLQYTTSQKGVAGINSSAQ